MRIGEVLRFSNVEHRPDPTMRLGYKAKRDEVFVAVYLGTEKRDGSDDLDPVAVMERLGWQRIDDPGEVNDG